MAYRRPLTKGQSLLIAFLWVALLGYLLSAGALALDGATVLLLLLSAVLVFYPIVKSWRQRKR